MHILIMKFPENQEKDPIKDKYTRKVGFFKKIHIKFIESYKSIKSNKEAKDEVASFVSILVGVITYGILGSLAMHIFRLDIGILNALGIGSGLWLIENKFTDIVTRILGSIKLVQVYS